jgi:nucleoside-diphosphate-sugar epimerase
MRVFVTGATGFVGSAVVQELISAGHTVLGLARSDAAAKALVEVGAEVHRGDLENAESLRAGAAAVDGVIHTGFIHDFARFQEVCEIDGRAIEAIGSELVGTNKPLIITAGVALIAPGRHATEKDAGPLVSDAYPRVSEKEAALLTARGVHVSVVRLAPSVHGEGDYGFVPMLVKLAQEKGVSAYIEGGLNRWSAVHRFDAAHLYRLVLEKGAAGASYHGIAEEGIAFREIAEAIGRGLNLPVVSKSQEDAAEHFGWFSGFAGLDCPASSQQTRAQLGWQPKHLELMADLERASYFKS